MSDLCDAQTIWRNHRGRDAVHRHLLQAWCRLIDEEDCCFNSALFHIHAVHLELTSQFSDGDWIEQVAALVLRAEELIQPEASMVITVRKKEVT